MSTACRVIQESPESVSSEPAAHVLEARQAGRQEPHREPYCASKFISLSSHKIRTSNVIKKWSPHVESTGAPGFDRPKYWTIRNPQALYNMMKDQFGQLRHPADAGRCGSGPAQGPDAPIRPHIPRALRNV
uniref:FOXM1 n=1 Tax=Macrostomum lignano TaxID=282301 RepID=A0A1I8FII0_9PLAT